MALETAQILGDPPLKFGRVTLRLNSGVIRPGKLISRNAADFSLRMLLKIIRPRPSVSLSKCVPQ